MSLLCSLSPLLSAGAGWLAGSVVRRCCCASRRHCCRWRRSSSWLRVAEPLLAGSLLRRPRVALLGIRLCSVCCCCSSACSAVGPSASSLARCLLPCALRLAAGRSRRRARSRRLLLSLLASSSCSPSRCCQPRALGRLSAGLARGQAAVARLALAAGCRLLPCALRLAALCWALLVLDSAGLRSGAGLCSSAGLCWALRLLGCWAAVGCELGVGSVASALLALAATVGSGWLLDGRRRVAVVVGGCRALAVVASALCLALCLCCPPSACRVAAALLAAAKCCCRLDWALLHGCWAAGLLGFWALLPGRRGSVRCLYQSRAVGARRERRAAQAVAQPVPAWLSAESAGLGLGIGGRESVSGLSSTGKDRSGEQADKRTYPGLVSRRQFAKPKARSDATSGSARLPKGQRRQTKPQHENAEHDPNGA